MSKDISETIGAAAGKVWQHFSENGQASVSKLPEEVDLDKNVLQRALGWLAREGKISIERKGRNELVSLIL